MTLEQWQQLWDRAKSQGNEVRDWVFEMITEAGFDVQDDIVIDPIQRRLEDWSW